MPIVTTPIIDKKMERIRSFTSGALKNFGLLFEKSFSHSIVLCMFFTKRFKTRYVCALDSNAKLVS